MLRKCGSLTLCLALLGSTGCVLALGNRENNLGGGNAKVFGVSGERDLELKQNGGAIILRSDSGKKYSVAVGETGQLVVAPIQ